MCGIASGADLVSTSTLSSSSPLSEPSVLSSGEESPKLLDGTGRKDDKEEVKERGGEERNEKSEEDNEYSEGTNLRNDK